MGDTLFLFISLIFRYTGKGVVFTRITHFYYVSKISIVDEDLLAERYYAGIKTHLCVGALRSFKLGYFKGQNINNISDLGMHLYKSGDAIKHEKGQDNLMEISSFMTELRKMWAVIQKEDTEHIDPYGYDVTINH